MDVLYASGERPEPPKPWSTSDYVTVICVMVLLLVEVCVVLFGGIR